MGSSVTKAMKVNFVNVDNGELDHLGDLSDVTSGLIGFAGPLVAISDLSWDKKDQDGEQRAKWRLMCVLSSDEIGNFTAYNEYCINDGILQTPDQKRWASSGGMKDMIANAFANAKEANVAEFSQMGYDAIAMKKFQYDLVGADREEQPSLGKNGMLKGSVVALLDSDEAVKQAIIDTYSARVMTSRKDGLPMTELMWDVQPWMMKSSSYMLIDEEPQSYPANKAQSPAPN